MNKKIILTMGAIGIFILFFFLFIQIRKSLDPTVFVQTLGDQKGIFVGKSEMNPMKSNPRTVSEVERVSNHQRELALVDKAHDHIHNGNSYSRQGNYERAAEEYQQAYAINAGFSKAVSGLSLAQTYEKLERYDDGISVLDEMIQNGNLSEKGIQNAQDLKSRLLAAQKKKKRGRRKGVTPNLREEED